MKTETKKRNVFRRVKRLTFSAVIMVTVLFAASANAQSRNNFAKNDSVRSKKPARTALNVCPGVIAFGYYSANVEHLLGTHHRLVLRGDWETIPQTHSDANIDAGGKAVIVNYRYHFGGGMNAFYTGAFARYRRIEGDGTLTTGNFNFSLPECTVDLNMGKRWVWNSGFILNFAPGYGYAYDELTVNNSSQATLDAIEVFRKE